MRPPECAVCGTEEGCELVSFRDTEHSREWRRRSQQEGFVGHPPNVEWFCAAHLAQARALAHLTLPEAMQRL